MLHFGEVEDEGHTGDEDEIEEAHGGKEVSHFSDVGTAQEHLEQHLDEEETTFHFGLGAKAASQVIRAVIRSDLVES